MCKSTCDLSRGWSFQDDRIIIIHRFGENTGNIRKLAIWQKEVSYVQAFGTLASIKHNQGFIFYEKQHDWIIWHGILGYVRSRTLLLLMYHRRWTSHIVEDVISLLYFRRKGRKDHMPGYFYTIYLFKKNEGKCIKHIRKKKEASYWKKEKEWKIFLCRFAGKLKYLTFRLILPHSSHSPLPPAMLELTFRTGKEIWNNI